MKQRLRALLDELHAELGDSAALDDEAKQQLKGLANEIEASLDENAGREQHEGSAAQVVEQLESAAIAFESEHPRLAGILANITDTLAKLGI